VRRIELCVDELVVDGGVGWSYDRRRRRAAPRIFHRRRRRGFMVGGGGVGGVRPDARALEQRTRWTGIFSGFTGLIHFTCDLCYSRWRRKDNCEYACCAQFHSYEFLEAHINAMLSVKVTLM